MRMGKSIAYMFNTSGYKINSALDENRIFRQFFYFSHDIFFLHSFIKFSNNIKTYSTKKFMSFARVIILRRSIFT